MTPQMIMDDPLHLKLKSRRDQDLADADAVKASSYVARRSTALGWDDGTRADVLMALGFMEYPPPAPTVCGKGHEYFPEANQGLHKKSCPVCRRDASARSSATRKANRAAKAAVVGTVPEGEEL